jgi:chromosomal replication initiation ATPase DnaA
MNLFIKARIKTRQKLIEMDNYFMKKTLEAVQKHFGFTDIQIYGRSRIGELPTARHIFFYLCYNKFAIGPSSSARFLKRDHSTAVHGERKIRDLISVNDRVIFDLSRIEKLLDELIEESPEYI